MANETALNLDKLLEGDNISMGRLNRMITANRKFVNLFPEPIEKGRFIFRILEYPKLTREQIKETLVRNHLVNGSAESATNEALMRNYYITYEDAYTFVEMTNKEGNKVYEFQLRAGFF